MYDEPPIQPDDTRPTMTVAQLDADGSPRRQGSRALGLISLLGAMGFAAATIILLLSNSGSAPVPVPDTGDEVVEVLPTSSPTPITPTAEGQPDATMTPEIVYVPVEQLPTMDVSQIVALLSEPVRAADAPNPYVIRRDALDPFTVIPDRPRNRVIEHVIERGDTISDLALRYGLEQDSIAWSNDRNVVWTLIPGETLKIPPVDGAIHSAFGNDTIASIAEAYQVDDPYTIIDSEFNNLQGYTPTMQLPSGMEIFIPGGVGLAVDWSPPVIITSGGGGGSTGSSGGGDTVYFPAGPGACAPSAPGPSSGWQRPLTYYQITRGFSSWHQGIDLGAAAGAPVMAANTGRVIFAGWSTWGYGNLVALSHGPFITLYAHLSSYNVSCGQIVNMGQVIGGVGSTGNSSGDHLHFEIKYNGVSGDPSSTIPF